MNTFIIAILSAAICSTLNAFRGAGAGWLRPVIGLAAGAAASLAGASPVHALVTAAGIWLWLAQPWGRWYLLGQGSRMLSGPPSKWEAAIEAIADRVVQPASGWANALCWLIGGTAFALPLIALSPWWLALTPLTIWFYSLALRFKGVGPHVRWGEGAKGALIGLLAVLLAGCAQPQEPDWRGIALEVGQIIR